MKKFKEGWVYFSGCRKAHYVRDPELETLCRAHWILGRKDSLKYFSEDELQRKQDRCKACLKRLKKS